MSLLDQTGFLIKAGAIERMCHLSDQPAGRAYWQACVRVKRDDVADSGWQCGHTAIDRDEVRISGTAQKAVQLMQLAALAFPANPFSFPRIPEPSSVKQEKS